MANLCEPESFTLLDIVTKNGELKFRSPTTGEEFPAQPEDTLLYHNLNGTGGNAKFETALHFTPYVPINPRVIHKSGCSKCKNKLISFQRIGEARRVIYVCTCGHSWEE